MNVIVNSGQAVITRSGQGPYICTLDTAGRIQLGLPDPANSRIDLIVARIRDDRLGDTTTGFTVEPIPGKPTVPRRLIQVEQIIKGQQASESVAKLAGQSASRGARPLNYNGFKIPLMENLVMRAVRDAKA